MSSSDLDQVRAEFAERIRAECGLQSEALVRGLATVPREAFVGPGPWRLLHPREMEKGYQTTPDDDPRHLYDKVLVALDPARSLNNGEPSSLLRWLDALSLGPGDRFLHVGCGVGYYTAIAAQAVLPGGRVVGIEIDSELAERARHNLAPYANVEVAAGDGSALAAGTFDALLVNAGATELPAVWLDALAPGGRLLVPLTVTLPAGAAVTAGDVGGGLMLRVTRQGEGYAAAFAGPVGIFHCAGARTPEGEALLRAAFASGGYQEVCTLRREPHERQAECWLHAPGFCLSRALP
jgi:protein-L-isoaspartate(D-aspartate) O-methyltransferase